MNRFDNNSEYIKLRQSTALFLRRLIPFSLLLLLIGLVIYLFLYIEPDIFLTIFCLGFFVFFLVFAFIRDILTYLTTIYIGDDNIILFKRLGKTRKIDLNNFRKGVCMTSRGYRARRQLYYEVIILASYQEWIVIDPSFLSDDDREYLLYKISEKIDKFEIKKLANPRNL